MTGMSTFVSKICSNCKEEKSLDQFYKENRRTGTRPSSRCIPCIKNKAVESQSKDRVRHLLWKRRANYKHRYGISPEEKLTMLESQNYKCKICAAALNFSTANLDHCHSSGKIRGILCCNCNRALGLFQDNVDFLQAAIVYLK